MAKQRCQWASQKSVFFDYHDREWGRPQHDDAKLFEMLTLESAQSGLSWETILAKREGYREAFHQFDIARVAAMKPAQVDKLLTNPAIVRHRLKIESTIANARTILSVQQEHESLDHYLWSFVGGKPIVNQTSADKDLPASTELSVQMSKAMKKRGFKFLGPTTLYAFMQAAGLINDHRPECFLYGKKLRAL